MSYVLQMEAINGKYFVYFRNEKTCQNMAIYQDSAGLVAISQGTSEKAIRQVAKGYSLGYAKKLFKKLMQEM